MVAATFSPPTQAPLLFHSKPKAAAAAFAVALASPIASSAAPGGHYLKLSPIRQVATALIAAAVTYVMASNTMQHFNLRTPEQAKIEASKFLNTCDKTTLHYVAALPPVASDGSDGQVKRVKALLHCNHGFGANCFTFDPFLRALPSSIAAVAHDRVGFGLTSRPRAFQYYGPDAACNHGLQLIEAIRNKGNTHARIPPSPTVFLGHSMGAAVSARMAASLHHAGCSDLALVLIAHGVRRDVR